MFESLHDEAVALFRFLKSHEESISSDVVPIMTRIERELYGFMSIEEIERLSKNDEGSITGDSNRRK